MGDLFDDDEEEGDNDMNGDDWPGSSTADDAKSAPAM
jgi:hypothetical protein